MTGARRFRLEVGVVGLDVAIEGGDAALIDAFVHGRAAAFVDRSSGDRLRTVQCDVRFDGPDWLPYSHPRGGTEPVAERLDDGSWDVEWCYYRATFAHDRADIVASDRATALEHVLRGAAIFAAMPAEALFFHAAALVFDGDAYLFPGHSGAGKSTIAREGGAERVIANEIAICARDEAGAWWLLPSPFWGTGDQARYEAPARLRAIAVLGQSTEANVWRVPSHAEAVALLMPHVGVQAAAQLADPSLVASVASLAGAVPTASLQWLRSAHPLQGAPWKR